MEHLARQGLPCPLPVHARDGSALRRAAGQARGHRHLPRRPLAAPDHGRALRGPGRGAGGACIWPAPTSPRPAPTPSPWPAGTRCSRRCRGKADAGRARAGGRDRGRARRISRRPGRTSLPSGVIHADLFPDNVFFAGDAVTGIIDFYFACNDLLAYDVAICLNAWCFEADGSFNLTKAQALLQGYRRAAHAVAGRDRGPAGPGPRLGPALPDDPPLRLAAPGRGCAGHAQGPARVPEEAPLPPRRGRPVAPTACRERRPAGRRAGRDPHRRRLQRQSRPGRLGCDPAPGTASAASCPAASR